MGDNNRLFNAAANVESLLSQCEIRHRAERNYPYLTESVHHAIAELRAAVAEELERRNAAGNTHNTSHLFSDIKPPADPDPDHRET